MNKKASQPTKILNEPLAGNKKESRPTKILSTPLGSKDVNAPLFPRVNILMMAGCLALIVLGFILMTGGSSSVETGFNPDIFSTRRIVVGPTIAFLGFLLMAFAIIWTPKKKSAATEK